LKAQAAARNAAKKKEKEDEEAKEKEALRMAAIVGLLEPGASVSGAAVARPDGTVKGSDPGRDCQSYPAVLRDPSALKEGEQFDFLKKDFDVPQRVAARADCTGVSVGQLKTHFDDASGMELDDFDEEGEEEGSAEYIRRMSSIDEAREPASMRRSPKQEKERTTLTKKDLDKLLGKDKDAMSSMLEAGSFFDLFELGDVVSAALTLTNINIIAIYNIHD
jgi:hypothetical protein